MPRPKSTLAVDLSKPCELTSGLIDRLRCPAGTQQVFLRDSKSPGLRVRATSGGSKSFVFEAKLRRQTVRRTIGDVRAWSIEAARSEANRLRVALDMGNDPRVADREERERHRVLSEDEARRATTFAQAWDCYLEARKAVWRGRTHFDHTAMVAAGGRPERRGTRGRGVTIAGPLYPLLAMRLVELNAHYLESWAKIQGATRPTSGRLAWRCLKAFLNWSSQDERFAGLADPAIARGSRIREAFGRPKVRSDVLEREQLAAWCEAVQAVSNPVIAAALQIILLTCQ